MLWGVSVQLGACVRQAPGLRSLRTPGALHVQEGWGGLWTLLVLTTVPWGGPRMHRGFPTS